MIALIKAASMSEIGDDIGYTDHGVAIADGNMLLNGPYTISGAAHYIVDMPASALPALQAKLGASNARRYIDALRDTAAVRAHGAANLRPINNASPVAVTYAAPLVFCGHGHIDMDEAIEDAPEL